MRCFVNAILQDYLQTADRGLAYGEGLFETIQIQQGQPLLLSAHWDRLRLGVQKLGLPNEALNALEQDLSSIQLPETGVLKLILTGGSGARGYAQPESFNPTRIIQITDLPDYSLVQAQGVRLCTVKMKLGLNPSLAGIKHLNRLEQVLAKQELKGSDIDDALLLDYENNIVSTIQANIFWCKNKQIYTPDLTRAGVSGVVRAQLLAIFAKQNIQVKIGSYTLSELDTADEIFICNSLMNICPVIELDTKAYAIGTFTKQAQNYLKQAYSC